MTGQRLVDVQQLIAVDVDQFYGIEIEEFPAQIAQVALWLIDHQMNLRVSEEFGLYFARIPLVTSPHIVHGNALRINWADVLSAERCSYVLGNPPFVGKQFQSPEQKADMAVVMRGIKGSGVLDLVCAWYVKATHYTKAVNPSPGMSAIGCAFVSTNSITQGEQVGVLWGWLLGQGVKIQFAHRTFQWSNEARGMAAVHCVIVGFGRREWERRTIFECEHIQGEPHAVPAANINPYLVDGPDVALGNRRSPICRVPPISFGSMPNDGGNLLLSDDERLELIGDEPMARQWIRPFSGSVEFINNEVRWCLWLRDCSPSALRRMPRVARRIAAVKAHREKSDRPATRALAALPMIFGEDRQPIGQYLAIPKTSSERRQFIPIAVAPSTCIASTELFTIFPVESLYFGVLC